MDKVSLIHYTMLRHVSLTTVDVGLAQLAMHSAWETAGAEDTGYLLRAAGAFYGSVLRPDGQGGWEIR